ncbi:MAG TPA: hypothetical protein PK140_25415 [Polyangiaceae bacterium]|jgi:hypothetical protein|nr:hypothetical protein [Polyangiaceae bacterium]
MREGFEMKMIPSRLFSRVVAFAVLSGSFFGAAAAMTSSSGDQQPAKGGLMLVVQTDMPIPKDVDSMRLEIIVYGQELLGRDYPLGPKHLLIPATLAIIAGGVIDHPVKLTLKQTGL